MPSTPRTAREPGIPPSRAQDAAVAVGCVLLGLAYGAFVWMQRGPEHAQQYLAGYLIELSLSVDNVFIFALVFEQFDLDPRSERRLLLWGVVGAIVLRTAFLVAGIDAITRFAWLIPVFGALVLAAGIRLAAMRKGRKPVNPEGRAFRFVMRHAPAGLAALIIIETADLVFALDSLPAVLAVTHDKAIAIASNLLAILGLRSLFFVVRAAMGSLRFLNAGVAAVLSFVGIKMLAEPWYQLPTAASLAAVAVLLLASVAASLLWRKAPGA
jgi:tellurite resistance protein TerC